MLGIWYLFSNGMSIYFFITLFFLLLTIDKKTAGFEHNSIGLVVVILMPLGDCKS